MSGIVHCTTPPMGWNSFCTCRCEPSEKLMLEVTDLIIDLGLADLGYKYVNLDDGWLKKTRDANGKLQYRDDVFPHGMKYVTDYIHAKGLKAGTYLGAGITTWNEDAGSLGHEFEDARSIAEWGFDYLKYDRHLTDQDPPRDLVTEYIKMGLALKNCGRDIVYGICEHGTTKPWKWAHPVGSLWRTGEDVHDNWRNCENPEAGIGILDIMDDTLAKISSYGGYGGYNDPDMIVTGMRNQSNWMGSGCTTEEYRTVFALWSMLAAPLLIGADLKNISKTDLDILKSKGIIAIDQDPLCIPAKRVYHDPNSYDLWCRQLHDFKWAVAIVNRSSEKQTLGFTWEDLGLSRTLPAKITDAWTEKVIAHIPKGGEFSLDVKRHDTAVLILEPEISI